ncbi:MAG: hypothetical protein SFT93_02290 [Rickettsiaceae bacterium]|nr:hypothetical protein [Rickettsiaceae bacterium]
MLRCHPSAFYVSSPRRRGSREYKDWIPASAGMTKKGRGNDRDVVIPSKEGIQEI